MLTAIIMVIAILSYSSADTDFLIEDKKVNNWLGSVGAYFAEFLRTYLGIASLLIPVAIFTAGFDFFKGAHIQIIAGKIAGYFWLMLALSLNLGVFLSDFSSDWTGGDAGVFISQLLKDLTGQGISILISLVLLISGLLIVGFFSVSDLKEKFIKIVGRLKMGLKSLLKKEKKEDTDIPLNQISSNLKKTPEREPWLTRETVYIYKDKNGKKFYSTERLPMNNVSSLLKTTSDLSDDDYSPLPEEIQQDYSMIQKGEPFVQDALPLVQGMTQNYAENSKNQGVVTNDSFDDEYFENDVTEKCVYEYDEIDAIPELEIIVKQEEPVIEFNSSKIKSEVVDGIVTNRIRMLGSVEKVESMSETDEVDFFADQGAELDTKPVVMSVYEDETETEMIPVSGNNLAVKTKETERALLIDRDQPDDFTLEDEPVNVSRPKVFEEIVINNEYKIPVNFLVSSQDGDETAWRDEIRRNSEMLVATLNDFGIESKVVKVSRGPVITLYEVQIAPGIRVSKVVALSDDIAMALAASRVRIIAPIPGKSAIGVEIPNIHRDNVTLGDVLNTPVYQNYQASLKVALGQDVLGKPMMLDLKKQPHLLIAGSTGSGKSVCVNTLITSLIYKYDPNYLRFIMIDPKMVELQLYNGLPHQLTPVITEPHIAPRALKWAVYEMERRYRLLSEIQTRDIESYNQKAARNGPEYEQLPFIVIIVDELADLMMVAPKDTEGYITRIAQKARAVGIHLVLATQRPSVDIITGVIKANFPARIAFQVAQKIDSRTIIDQNGAEKLLGRGDMLYLSPAGSYPVRIQGAYISEEEIIAMVQHARKLGKPRYIDIEGPIVAEEAIAAEEEDDEDELFVEALKIIEETQKASASYLQRRLSIGYNRAARMIEKMEELGYIGPQQGSKPREVYM